MAKSLNGVVDSFEDNLLNNETFYQNPNFQQFVSDYSDAVQNGYEPSIEVIDALLAFDTTTLDMAELEAYEELLGELGLLGLDIYQTSVLDVQSQYAGNLEGTDYADSIVVNTADGFGIFNAEDSTISTGAGDDLITGIGDAFGILNLNNSIISTGIGNDSITGIGGDVGIYNVNNSTISTGAGNDSITGIGNFYGIANIGIIELGDGDDLISASSFHGTGIIDGGNDFDIVEFEQSFTTLQSEISVVGSSIYLTNFLAPTILTLEFVNFEQFNFADQTFNLAELSAAVSGAV